MVSKSDIILVGAKRRNGKRKAAVPVGLRQQLYFSVEFGKKGFRESISSEGQENMHRRWKI